MNTTENSNAESRPDALEIKACDTDKEPCSANFLIVAEM
jgi:hypothetical protein